MAHAKYFLGATKFVAAPTNTDATFTCDLKRGTVCAQMSAMKNRQKEMNSINCRYAKRSSFEKLTDKLFYFEKKTKKSVARTSRPRISKIDRFVRKFKRFSKSRKKIQNLPRDRSGF